MVAGTKTAIRTAHATRTTPIWEAAAYYGGRFTPAQAYAASHPSARPPARPPTGRVAAPPVRASAPPSPDTAAALRQLRDSGVLTAEEYVELTTRVKP